MILLCCASELGLPEDLSAIEVILYYYYYYSHYIVIVIPVAFVSRCGRPSASLTHAVIPIHSAKSVSQVLVELPLSHVLVELPLSHVLVELPLSHVLVELPLSHVLVELPLSHVLVELPLSHVLVDLPLSHVLVDLPLSHVLVELPRLLAPSHHDPFLEVAHPRKHQWFGHTDRATFTSYTEMFDAPNY